jgi:hypothetical protein
MATIKKVPSSRAAHAVEFLDRELSKVSRALRRMRTRQSRARAILRDRKVQIEKALVAADESGVAGASAGVNALRRVLEIIRHHVE